MVPFSLKQVTTNTTFSHTLQVILRIYLISCGVYRRGIFKRSNRLELYQREGHFSQEGRYWLKRFTLQ
uniref:Uncharacterized protein n=1 Tax=Daphnia magna TaxID=35525 RepID=A0A0P6HZ41_9CRUS